MIELNSVVKMQLLRGLVTGCFMSTDCSVSVTYGGRDKLAG